MAALKADQVEGFLFVYSITSRESFEEIATFYQNILRFKGKGGFSAILVANKCDLEDEREVGVHGAPLPSLRYNILLSYNDQRHDTLLTVVVAQRVETLPIAWGVDSFTHLLKSAST